MHNRKPCMGTVTNCNNSCKKQQNTFFCTPYCGWDISTLTRVLSHIWVLSYKLPCKVKIRKNKGKTSQPTQAAAVKPLQAEDQRHLLRVFCKHFESHLHFQIHFYPACLLQRHRLHAPCWEFCRHFEINVSKFMQKLEKISNPNQLPYTLTKQLLCTRSTSRPL